MNKDTVFDAVTELDGELIEEAESYSPKKRRFKLTPLKIIAACLCIFIIGGIGVVAFTDVDEIIMDYVVNRGNDVAYKDPINYESKMNKFPMSDFGEDVRALEDIFKKQHENYDPLYSSTSPSSYSKSFNSREELLEFVELEELYIPKMRNAIPMEDVDSLHASGDEDGKVWRLSVYTGENFKVGKDDYISAWYSINIHTENYIDDAWIRYDNFSSEFKQYAIVSFVTKNDVECVLVTPVTQNNRQFYHAHIVKDGIWYTYRLSYTDEYQEEALELVFKWAKLF